MLQKTPRASKKSRAPRAPNLDDRRISEIVKLLDGWTGKLTWELLADAIERAAGARYTRQSLDRHVRIKEAYLQVRERVGGVSRVPAETHELSKAEVRRRLEDYDRLKNEVARLERENNNYAQQFVRWVWNLRMMKISEDQLSQLDVTLPPASR
jgi:hypothetical protein